MKKIIPLLAIILTVSMFFSCAAKRLTKEQAELASGVFGAAMGSSLATSVQKDARALEIGTSTPIVFSAAMNTLLFSVTTNTKTDLIKTTQLVAIEAQCKSFTTDVIYNDKKYNVTLDGKFSVKYDLNIELLVSFNRKISIGSGVPGLKMIVVDKETNATVLNTYIEMNFASNEDLSVTETNGFSASRSIKGSLNGQEITFAEGFSLPVGIFAK